MKYNTEFKCSQCREHFPKVRQFEQSIICVSCAIANKKFEIEQIYRGKFKKMFLKFDDEGHLIDLKTEV